MIALLTALASAQYQPPVLAADIYRPAIDSDHGFATVPASTAPGGSARLELGHLRGSLVRIAPDGTEETVLESATVLHMGAQFAWPMVAIGLQTPAYLTYGSDFYQTSGPMIGDPTLDAKLYTPWDGPLTAALIGRLGTSMGAATRQLGEPGLTVQLGGALTLRGGPLRASTNLGLHAAPQEIDPAPSAARLLTRTSVGVDLGPVRPIAEVHGYLSPSEGANASPLEGTLGAMVDVGGFSLHAGASAAMSSGIGAASARGVLGISTAQ